MCRHKDTHGQKEGERKRRNHTARGGSSNSGEKIGRFRGEQPTMEAQVREQQRPSAEVEQSQQEKERTAVLLMVALAIQYGVQPLITKRFTGRQVITTSAVIACEMVKTVGSLVVMAWDGSLWRISKDWRLFEALKVSALPAAVYAVQNTMLQLSYRHLDSLTFSLLNQTKLVFTAVFMFLFLGHRQSRQQVGALLMLMVAAILLSLGESAPKQQEHDLPLVFGIVPLLFASILSGLASTLCQWASQVKRRGTYLMTVEMSTLGIMFLLTSMLGTPDGTSVRQYGFFYGWTSVTIVPVLTNAIGGILVGFVTQYSGGVKKGFVIVSALLVTAALDVVVDGAALSPYVALALPLVVCSTVIHQRYPSQPKEKAS